MAAQACLPNNDTRDRFAADCSYLSRLWEAISPDPILSAHETDYRWLIYVYESVKPVSDTRRLLWHRLGAKTIELIHEHVHVEALHDDLETLVVDAYLLGAVLGSPDPKKKTKEIEITITRRLRAHQHDPRYKALAERLEELKERHEQGLLLSVDFLKALLDLAKDVVATEQASSPIEQEERVCGSYSVGWSGWALIALRRNESNQENANSSIWRDDRDGRYNGLWSGGWFQYIR